MKDLTIDYALRATWQAVIKMYNEEAKSLSRILKSIEEKGYIERKPNPNDGRGVLIHLTSLGLTKRRDSKEVVLRFNEAVKEDISEEDLIGFFNTVEVINKLILDKKIYSKTTTN
jgi:DNA-binding MarR family transcriptional regulator